MFVHIVHRTECQHFGLTEPDFTAVREVHDDLMKHQEMWKLFEDFKLGLTEMAKEDWISFRCCIHFSHLTDLWTLVSV